MEEEKQKYINLMYEALELPDENKRLETFMKLYISYSRFCYQNNLSTYNVSLFDKAKSLFIIESDPIDYDIDNEKKEEALYHLETALKNKKIGILDGISMEDANTILESVVQNTRVGFANNIGENEFFKDSLSGSCGLSQASTVFPLMKIHADVTINNVSSLPDCIYRHAFATCTLPIKENDKIYNKQFLIDATYRQFFLAILCNEGRYLDSDPRIKDKVAPRAGYFVCHSLAGKNMALELLTKGYIELTSKNAKLYGRGFSYETIYLSTLDSDINRIVSHTGDEYIKAINDKNLQEELDYTEEDLIGYGFNLDLHNKIDSIKKNKGR